MFQNKEKNQKGVSLYLTVVVLFGILAIALGLAVIIVGQIKTIRGIGNSIVAFYASDSGIEKALYNIRKLGISDNFGESWGLDYGFDVSISSCASKQCVRSTGTYKDTKRAIEASY